MEVWGKFGNYGIIAQYNRNLYYLNCKYLYCKYVFFVINVLY